MRLFRFSDFDNNFDALSNLQKMIDNFFGESSPYYNNNSSVGRVFPPVNIFEQGDDTIVIKSELPGIKKEDIDISIKEKMITISGIRKIREDKKASEYSYHRKERPEGEFSRTLKLPYLVNNDKITADYHDGVLTIKLEKAEEAKSRKISIS